MKLPRVMIGFPIGSGSLPWATAASLIGTMRVLDKEGIKVRIESLVGSSIVQWARSVIAGKFLKSDFTHLFWIDADVVWTPDDFVRLLGFGAQYDVVAATYPFKADTVKYFVNPATPGQWEINGHGLIKIRNAGLGFTLCKRAVMEKIAATKTTVHDDHNNVVYPDIFRVDYTRDANGRATPRGEDCAFFDDVRAAGFEAWLDPSINLGHVGPKVYGGNVIDTLGLQEFAKEIA